MYDNGDALVHFTLALEFVREYQIEAAPNPAVPVAARVRFKTMLSLNSDLEESKRAGQYLAQIESQIAGAAVR